MGWRRRKDEAEDNLALDFSLISFRRDFPEDLATFLAHR